MSITAQTTLAAYCFPRKAHIHALPSEVFMSVSGFVAVAHKFNEPLHLEQFNFRDPEPDEVLVRVHTSGVCHTDVHAVDGDWPLKPTLPFIPGHEGVGVVARLGSAVKGLKEGDRVGTRDDLREALSIAADSGIRSLIETQPLSAVNEALDRLKAGKVEGRIVLTM